MDIKEFIKSKGLSKSCNSFLKGQPKSDPALKMWLELYHPEEFSEYNGMKSYSLMFASWFTGTCLCQVKHETQGGHQLYPRQIKYSSGEYKSKLFANIKKAMETEGDYAKILITEHGTPQDLLNYKTTQI